MMVDLPGVRLARVRTPAMPPDSRLQTFAPADALRQAERWCWIGGAVGIGSLLVWPTVPLLQAAAVPLCLVAGWRIRRRRRIADSATAALGAQRGFRFDGHRIPSARGTDPGWTPAFPPFTAERVTDQSEGGPWQRWQLRLADADPAWRAVLAAQRSWLRDQAPGRWRLVTAWWTRHHLAPLLRRRHPDPDRRPTDATDRAAADCAVELAIGVAIAGQPELWQRGLGMGWERRAWEDLQRSLREAEPQPIQPATPFPRHRLPQRQEIFIGRGFAWDARHSQAISDLKLQDLSAVTDDPAEQGDPRIYGIGHRDVRDLFINETQFNQMAGIFGSNGVGKTVYASVLITQAIRNGHPVIIIDPKSDRDLLDGVVDEVRRHGRAHQFRYFSLAAPKRLETWDWLCRYNPCADYNDIAELASRLAAVVPQTGDAFWTNVAKGMIESCLTLCHWANWFLTRCGSGDRQSRRVPDLLLALQWARHHPAAGPVEAEAAILQLREQAGDPAWRPADAAEAEVAELLATTALSGVPVYTPQEWLPSIRQVSDYHIDNTTAFLGWMLRIFYPHAFLDDATMAAPAFPRQAAPAQIAGRSERLGSMWTVYRNQSAHPLMARYRRDLILDTATERWRAFYDHFWPDGGADEHYQLQRLFDMIGRQLDALYSDVSKDRQKFLEYATTLQNALKPFLGDKARIMCSIESDLSWDRVVDEGQVVYCGLGSMIDPEGAKGCAKLLVQDFASFIGRRYQYDSPSGGKPSPIYLVADEVGSFINDAFIDVLNKARGAGVRGIIIGQTTPDLARSLGHEGAQMVKGNLNTFIQLRSMLAEDAEDFARRAGDAAVIDGSRNVGITPSLGDAGKADIAAFQSNEAKTYSTREVSRVPASAVLNLPRGQAFIHAKGQVFLVAQGLFPERGVAFLEEIGFQPGLMRQPLVDTTAPASELPADRSTAEPPAPAPPPPASAMQADQSDKHAAEPHPARLAAAEFDD